MTMFQTITLNVNGDDHTLGVKPNETLQDLLRVRLGLTGTKKGCAVGVCGSCTILLDGEPVNSCMVLAVAADGRKVVTVEGLALGGRLHPLQASFIHHGAIQCGYCTPGMLLTAKALIDKDPDPSDDDIKKAFGGNLCRCTGYVKIIEAVRGWKEFIPEDKRLPFLADPLRSESPPETRSPGSVVGRSCARKDAPDKATGRAKYTGDIQLPGMLHGKLLHSPVAHALIKSIDTIEAAKLPGVRAVITGRDVSDVLYGVSPARYDEHVLAKDKVRYVGDEIAAVAAVDETTAARAVDLIRVEFSELPAVFTVEDAVKEGAPVIHDKYPNNVNVTVDHEFGDVEEGLREADLVMEARFTGNRTYQAPIEPHASLARWETNGRLTLWSSTQVPHYVQYQLARVLGLSMSDIRVIRPAVGGGFGGKAETSPLDFCAAYLARATGRPVMMKYDRNEMFLHGRGRHKQYIDLKIGVKKDGAITAVEQTAHLDGGAYTSFGIVAAYYSGAMVPTLYKLPRYKYTGRRVYTNLPACGAFRGHGCPQPRFAFESLLSMIAEKLGIDDFDIRLRNAMTPDTVTANQLSVNSCEFKATLEKAREASGWRRKKGHLPPGRGIGVGCGGFVSGAGYPIYRSDFPHSNAVIRVLEDGKAATLFIAAAEIGQGSDTALCQIAADELGVAYEDILMADCDSDISPLDLGSYSSRVTLMAGNAVKMAASRVKERLLAAAGGKLGIAPERLSARGRRIFAKDDPGRSMPWDEAARDAFSQAGPVVGTGFYKPPKLGGSHKGATVGTSPAYSFGTIVAEVEVDLETGKVKVLECTDYHDSGRIINPSGCHGQVHGAVVMSIGETLIESVEFDRKGAPANASLHEYLIPTSMEAPAIRSEFVESFEPCGPFGAKEVGEGCTLPVIGALANAIHDATGVRFTEMPITPESILAGLKAKAAKVPGAAQPH
ncbi:MAG: molybdopterin-dependent oxidoreductase [Elusimicrobia bacterium]|nr:molybdopterin-dependent oxidoreductase [Elusimicrobiota bacterium]